MTDYPITAFPTTEANWLNENVRTEGMELRDYFAAKVMQGLISSGSAKGETAARMSWLAYEMADAMMEARNK